VRSRPLEDLLSSEPDRWFSIVSGKLIKPKSLRLCLPVCPPILILPLTSWWENAVRKHCRNVVIIGSVLQDIQRRSVCRAGELEAVDVLKGNRWAGSGWTAHDDLGSRGIFLDFRHYRTRVDGTNEGSGGTVGCRLHTEDVISWWIWGSSALWCTSTDRTVRAWVLSVRPGDGRLFDLRVKRNIGNYSRMSVYYDLWWGFANFKKCLWWSLEAVIRRLEEGRVNMKYGYSCSYVGARRQVAGEMVIQDRVLNNPKLRFIWNAEAVGCIRWEWFANVWKCANRLTQAIQIFSGNLFYAIGHSKIPILFF
jgi:hypothetical protein